jgi:hypothetical protein
LLAESSELTSGLSSSKIAARVVANAEEK